MAVIDIRKSGKLDRRVRIKSRDQIGRLAEEFNGMLVELKNSRRKLESYSKNLEKEVKKRTVELEKKNKELERFNRMAVGRELRMVKLKKRIRELGG